MKSLGTLFVIALLMLASLVDISNVHAQSFPLYTGSYGSSGDVFVSGGTGVQPQFATTYQLSVLDADSSMSATSATESGLSFAAEADATYSVAIHVVDSVSASTGLKFDIYAVDSVTYLFGSAMGSKKSDTCGFDIITADSTLGAAFTTYVPTSNYGVWDAHITFVNGPTAQTVYLRYAKPTSGTAILKKYSTLEAWKKLQ